MVEHNVSLDALIEQLCREADGHSPFAERFGKAYLRRIPAEHLATMPPDAICAQVEDILRFARRREGRQSLVRVFTPTLDDNGYTSEGSVLEVVSPDTAFLVGSVSAELSANGLTLARVIHPVIGVVRDDAGRLTDVVSARQATARESVQHYELEEALDETEAEELEAKIRVILEDVHRAVSDFEPMQGAVYRMIKVAREGSARYPAEDIDEAVALLEWLLDQNFVFLGYREYEIIDTPHGRAISVVPHSGLGILSRPDQSRFGTPTLLDELSPDLRHRYEVGDLLVVTKTNNPSRVHRRARMDYIGVRHIDDQGRVSGEARLIGLFTSVAYMQPAESIPVLRRKLAYILDAEDAIPESHHYKQIAQLFNTFPKDELFATPAEDIRRSILGLIEVQERQQARLFLRRDLLHRNVSVLTVLPRDRFNARLRVALQDLFLERLGGTSVDYRLSLGDADTARIHFTVWTGEEVPDIDLEALEADVFDLARTWDERLEDILTDIHGRERGRALGRRWADRFPDYYKAATELEMAAGDVANLEELGRVGSPVVALSDESRPADADVTRLSIYKADGRLELSEVMPTLENFGLRVVAEVPTELQNGAAGIHIHDFGVLGADGKPLNLEACATRVAETVRAVLMGHAETDALSRLIINAGLDHHQVAILRSYRTYWQRVGSGFTGIYITEALTAHPDIAADLVALFEARFDPESASSEVERNIHERIGRALDAVESLDQDRILRGMLALIGATVRTNAYVPEAESLAFKFVSAEVPRMPAPTPRFEIYVYAPHVEGLHLRGGLVARGGIRWSVRREDYRTEVLGLMKAQMTKNAVIVPTGAKGAFVLRGSDTRPSFDEVRAAYQTFVRGLLDLTDNRVDDHIVHPDRVRVHDRPDPYLVVAADKGTATFSDTANEIARDYGFWLGDAFASGGSAGYDHKALGITARGAWESVSWHLRELGIDPDADAFTAIGIGDMSGDVFGNGMLLSQTMRLVAAFDHRHIFIDPDPNAAAAWAERQRLFELPSSSWDDYDRSLISAGGGVWSRSAKRIDLSPEARAALDIEGAPATPDEVIHAILRAPVDLLWNGGVGTFVKASIEAHADVGDRVNDGLRVDGLDLRCRVIGEGGNLGLTQDGRIEYAQAGGRLYTDFIDNSGGVNCSDREVNLKILLDLAVARGVLDATDRDPLIERAAEEVVEAILYDNYLQAQILAQEVTASPGRTEAYEELLTMLEGEGWLDRTLEDLPGSEELHARGQQGIGLVGPELAVLLTYAKRSLRLHLLRSDLPDEDEFDAELAGYFPAVVMNRVGDLVSAHPLRRELIATVIANRVVDSQGITFVSRLVAETGAEPHEVVRAYHVARRITGAPTRWKTVERMVGDLEPGVERILLAGTDRLVEDVTRRLLARPARQSVSELIERYRAGFEELAATIGQIGPDSWQRDRMNEQQRLERLGVPADVAREHAYQEDLAFGTDVVELAGTARSIGDVANVFLAVEGALNLDWLEEQLDHFSTNTRWHRRAIQALRDDIVALRRRAAELVLVNADDTMGPDEAIDHFLMERAAPLGQLTRFFRAMAADRVTDLAAVIVAIRQVEQALGTDARTS